MLAEAGFTLPEPRRADADIVNSCFIAARG
jgi:hypothetical protein